MTSCKLAIVVPCYNEEEALKKSIKTLLGTLDDLVSRNLISKESFLYLVDDGSVDATFEIIEDCHKVDKRVKALKFTKNFGNQSALIAGLTSVSEIGVDCAVTMDADLQQDESVIKDFIAKFNEGNDVVFGVRTKSQGVGFLKKFTSMLFYKLMNFLGAKTIPDHSEYRLMSKKALNILAQYGEYNLFLRGLFSHIGMKTANVPYVAKPRIAGETKFSWYSLTALALNGITSFSVVPLRMIVILGLFMMLVSVGFGLGFAYEKFVLLQNVKEWAFLLSALFFFGGLQIFCTGIIGEYLGQVFNEVKDRPRYLKDVELL